MVTLLALIGPPGGAGTAPQPGSDDAGEGEPASVLRTQVVFSSKPLETAWAAYDAALRSPSAPDLD